MGLGSLSPHKGLFVRILLPLFAGIALIADARLAQPSPVSAHRGVPAGSGRRAGRDIADAGVGLPLRLVAVSGAGADGGVSIFVPLAARKSLRGTPGRQVLISMCGSQVRERLTRAEFA